MKEDVELKLSPDDISRKVYQLGLQAGDLLGRKGPHARRLLLRNFERARALGVKIKIEEFKL